MTATALGEVFSPGGSSLLGEAERSFMGGWMVTILSQLLCISLKCAA